MQITRALWQHRQPMIRFLGRRKTPKQVDHTPQVHPESPAQSLPESFASYREKATQHGPLKSGPQGVSSSHSVGIQSISPYGHIGGHSGKQLGSVKPAGGEFWDRNELPRRFHRTGYTQAEIDAIESGGASMFG